MRIINSDKDRILVRHYALWFQLTFNGDTSSSTYYKKDINKNSIPVCNSCSSKVIPYFLNKIRRR